METEFNKRSQSLSIENPLYSTFSIKYRELKNAVQRKDASFLLNRSSKFSSYSTKQTEFSDDSAQLILLRKTFDSKKLEFGKTDRTVSQLRRELHNIELKESKYDQWKKQTSQKVQQLNDSLDLTLIRPADEMNDFFCSWFSTISLFSKESVKAFDLSSRNEQAISHDYF